MTYTPQYHVLKPTDFVPREQITLIPEADLNPTQRAELRNVRNGTEYTVIVGDTPENRHAMQLWTGYLQMVAYKEGWRFDPQKYQLHFEQNLPEGHRRVYGYGEDTRALRNEGWIVHSSELHPRDAAATAMTARETNRTLDLVARIRERRSR